MAVNGSFGGFVFACRDKISCSSRCPQAHCVVEDDDDLELLILQSTEITCKHYHTGFVGCWR